jgi:tRNA A-37 threonylcarbamoyl transferase component Bud32
VPAITNLTWWLWLLEAAAITNLVLPWCLLQVVTGGLNVASGLGHMHEYGFGHGDIKPNNILMFKTSSGDFEFKVADLPAKKIHLVNKFFGGAHARTDEFMGPE